MKMVHEISIQNNEKEGIQKSCKWMYKKRGWEHGIKFWIELQPEHVHYVTAIPLRMSQTYALQILKGVSSRLFFSFMKERNWDIRKDIYGA